MFRYLCVGIPGSIVGKWGEYFVNGGVLISVLACWLV